MKYDRSVDRRNWAFMALQPGSWISRAEDLLDAAAKVEPSVEEQLKRIYGPDWWKKRDWFSEGPLPTYFMLAAFALENLLKAALVRKHEAEFRLQIETTHKLPDTLKTHDLFKLMAKFGLAPTDRMSENLVRRLTRAAEWFGRYPIPLKADAVNLVKYSDGEEYSVWLVSAEDVAAIKQLVMFIRSELSV
jgi:hypothetical protein